MIDDEHIRRWSNMAADLDAWLAQEITEDRGPSRAICLPDDDRALGRVALRLPEHASAATRCEAITDSDKPAGELSYWLVPEARGRGLAYAAVKLMMSSIVARTKLRSVVLDIEPANIASASVAGRLGAERREPPRVELDRTGTERTLVVFVLRCSGGVSAGGRGNSGLGTARHLRHTAAARSLAPLRGHSPPPRGHPLRAGESSEKSRRDARPFGCAATPEGGCAGGPVVISQSHPCLLCIRKRNTTARWMPRPDGRSWSLSSSAVCVGAFRRSALTTE
jgi:RimJ/RimL family protein N-acetyltransferase